MISTCLEQECTLLGVEAPDPVPVAKNCTSVLQECPGHKLIKTRYGRVRVDDPVERRGANDKKIHTLVADLEWTWPYKSIQIHTMHVADES